MFLRKVFLFFIFLSSIQLYAGTITVSVSSLYNYGNCPVYYATSPQKFIISGSALTQNILVQAPEHFEISINCNTGFASNLQLIPTSGSVSNTLIYCRFSPYTTGTKTGSISNSSAGCTSVNITVNGNASATPAQGTNASTYYSAISTTQSGSALKTVLYNKILGHTVTAYGSGSSGLWATYPSTDPFYNGKVWDIYSTSVCGTSPYEFTFSTDQCGSYSIEGDCYNREHSFPQSWFTSSSPMVSDMFHIYPTDGKVNGMRNNYPFGEVSSPTYTSLLGGKLGSNTFAGYTGTVFEPVDEYKGDLARSYFYMATRYENLIAGWQGNGNANDVLAGNSFPAYDPWVINLMQKWHNQDPPGVKEINRNNAVYGYQVNRNPYIDSPQYVYKVWGGIKPAEPTIAASNFVIKSSTLGSTVISWKCGNGNRRMVIARASSTPNSLPVDSGYYVANSAFGSGTQIGSGNYVVYDGMGCTAQVTVSNTSLTYYFTVVEYNGQGITANYLSSSVLQSTGVFLPVEWLSFNGKIENEKLMLDWQTASETNTSHFDIMQSTDAIHFETIGSVRALGNSKIKGQYSFESEIPSHLKNTQAVFYYKLKLWNRDGNFSFSKTIELHNVESFVNLKEATIITEPNPFENEFRILCNNCNGEAELLLTDLTGKIILRQQIKLKDETTVYFKDMLADGMYFLHLLQRTNQQTLKIIKR
ncbi:MAG: endonuclease [Bacteroidota bacterium]|nr:endonuclease [Bacteroidota bacterium]